MSRLYVVLEHEGKLFTQEMKIHAEDLALLKENSPDSLVSRESRIQTFERRWVEPALTVIGNQLP